MITLAVANHKGGVGKTATVVNLSYWLAQAGRRVLVVDADPQGAATAALGIDPPRNLADVLGAGQPGKAQARDVIVRSSPFGVDLLPGGLDLAGSELAMTIRLGREALLKKALQPMAGKYDVCLIDCPPSLGLLTINALAAADGVIVPCQPQAADLRALKQFLDTLSNVGGELAPGLQLVGVLVTFFDPRYNHHKEAVQAIEGGAIPMLPVKIGRSVKVAEACGSGQPLAIYDPANPQNENYRQLAEIINKWQPKSG